MPVDSRHQHQRHTGQLPLPPLKQPLLATRISSLHCKSDIGSDQPDRQSERRRRTGSSTRRHKRSVRLIRRSDPPRKLMMNTQPVPAQWRMIGIAAVFRTKRLDRCPWNQIVPTESPRTLDQVNPLLDIEDLINRQSGTLRHRRITSRRVNTRDNTNPSHQRHRGRRPGAQNRLAK
jgi:hypothetical protein